MFFFPHFIIFFSILNQHSFHVQEDFYIVHDHIAAFFLLLLKDFNTFNEPFRSLALFF